MLDNAAWAALNGPHRHLAQTVGSAARYRTDVSPFVAVADPGQPQSWADLADLVGAGNSFAIAGVQTLPDGWDTGQSEQGVQMVATAVEARTDLVTARAQNLVAGASKTGAGVAEQVTERVITLA